MATTNLCIIEGKLVGDVRHTPGQADFYIECPLYKDVTQMVLCRLLGAQADLMAEIMVGHRIILTGKLRTNHERKIGYIEAHEVSL